MREETLTRLPEVGAALHQLAGIISDEDMRRLNFNVDGQHQDIREVVREFLKSKHLD